VAFAINSLNNKGMDGIKRKRRCEIECKDHIFAVQTLKGNTSKYDIKLQFCPKYQREPLPPEHTYPEYNDDDKFYTSAFILGVDRRVLIKNEQQELMDHQKQIRDSLEKHNQLVLIPLLRYSQDPTPSTPSALSAKSTTKTIIFILLQNNTEKKLL
jgi:hypothetical protein